MLYKTTWVRKSAENPAGTFIKDDRSQDCFSGQFKSAKFKDKEHNINAPSFYTLFQKKRYWCIKLLTFVGRWSAVDFYSALNIPFLANSLSCFLLIVIQLSCQKKVKVNNLIYPLQQWFLTFWVSSCFIYIRHVLFRSGLENLLV